MFEFQIVRYEGSDYPDELVIEISSHENPESSETIFHQDYHTKDLNKSEKDLMQSPITISAPGILSILLYMQDQELGVIFPTELLQEIRNVQYLPLYSPAREVDSLDELVENPRILVAISSNNEETGDFYTSFSFYVYKKYVDLKRTNFIDEIEFSRKLKNLEFESLRLANESSIQRALKDDREEELEMNKCRNGIIKGNMEAVVSDLEFQRSELEKALERGAEKFEKLNTFTKSLEDHLEDSYNVYDSINIDVQTDIQTLMKKVNSLTMEKCQSDNKVKKLEFDLRMLEQNLTLEKLRNCAKGMKEDFYKIFKEVLSKETSGSFSKMIDGYEFQLQTLRKEFNESLLCIHRLEDQLKDSQFSYEQLKSSLNDKIVTTSSKKKGIKQQLASIQDQLMNKKQKIRAKKQELQQKTEEFTKETQKTQDSFKVMQKLWESEKKDILTQKEILKSQFLSEKNSLISKHQETINDFEIIIKTNKASFEAEKLQDSQEFEKKIKQLSQKFESDKKIAFNQAQEQLRELENILAQTKSAHEQEKKKLNSEKIAKSQEYEKIILASKEKYEQDLLSKRNEQSLLVKQHESALSQSKALFDKEKERLLNEFEVKNNEYKKNLAQIKSESLLEVEAVKNGYEQKLSELKLKSLNELKSAKNEYESVLSNLKSEIYAEKQKFIQDSNKSKKEYDDLLRQKDSFISAEKQNWHKELKDTKAKYEELLKETINQLNMDKQSSIQLKIQEFEATKKQLIQSFDRERLKLTTESQDQAKEFEHSLAKAQESHEKLILNLTQSFESKLHNKEVFLTESEKRFEHELKSKQREYDTKISELTSQITLKDQKIQEITFKLQNLNTEAHKMQKTINELEEKLKQEQKAKTEQAEELWVKYEEMKYSYEETLVTEKYSFEENQKALEIEIRNLKAENSALEKEKNGFREKFQQGQENFLIKLKVLQDENAFLNVQIQQNLEKYQEDLQFSKKKYENLKMVTEKQQELAMQESELVRDQLSQEITHLSRQMQSINDLRLRENENSSQIIKDIKENMEIVLRNTTDHYESKITELTKELTVLQASMNTLSDQCDKKIKESNRSFKELTVHKVLTTCEFIENIHPLSAPNSLSHTNSYI